ncbi:MAG: hypothetical protein ACLP62_14485 [Acidimicrobiales bacterium]
MHVDDVVFVNEKVSSMVPAAPDDPVEAMASCEARQVELAAAVVEVVVDGDVEVDPPVEEVVLVVEVVAAPVVEGGDAGPPQPASQSAAPTAVTTIPALCHRTRAGRRVRAGAARSTSSERRAPGPRWCPVT